MVRLSVAAGLAEPLRSATKGPTPRPSGLAYDRHRWRLTGASPSGGAFTRADNQGVGSCNAVRSPAPSCSTRCSTSSRAGLCIRSWGAHTSADWCCRACVASLARLSARARVSVELSAAEVANRNAPRVRRAKQASPIARTSQRPTQSPARSAAPYSRRALRRRRPTDSRDNLRRQCPCGFASCD